VRSLADAQHEAAHVVVGLALGLRLLCVRLGAGGKDVAGYTEWSAVPWPREAGLLMTAAGLAWERHCGDLKHAHYDVKDLRRAGVRGNARIRVLERAAWAVLASRHSAHALITRALLERDLTSKDVSHLIRGERLRAE
jgi:hypothetical protein